MPDPTGVSAEQARRFLVGHHGSDVGPVELVGEGGWSRCFGYVLDGRELVVRFGRFVEDFEKDALAATFTSAALPVPAVLHIGSAPEGYAVISTRAHGRPLESLDAAGWEAVLPALLAALDAARTVDPPPTAGYGLWDGQGRGPADSWRKHLLSVGAVREERLPGWQASLAAWPAEQVVFDQARRELQEAVAACPETQSLVHGDLINANVLVEGQHITAVFDWGCALWGDPLYDLAWLSFWAPWHPGLAATDIRGRVLDHLADVGFDLVHADTRLRCYWLHLTLDALGYNAFLGNRGDAVATVDRLHQLLGSTP